VVADGLSEDDYAAFLGEAVESWSYLKFPYYKPLGYPAGMYRVGPMPSWPPSAPAMARR
jgi:NAD-reducing hydrogenase large subunit